MLICSLILLFFISHTQLSQGQEGPGREYKFSTVNIPKDAQICLYYPETSAVHH